jgi:hypothetical protein
MEVGSVRDTITYLKEKTMGVPDLSGKSAKFRDIKEINAIPSMKAKLTSYIDEAVKSKSKIQFEQDHLKQIREAARDEIGLKPAIFNAYVQVVFNNDYLERKSKLEELVDMIDAVMTEGNLLPPPEED